MTTPGASEQAAWGEGAAITETHISVVTFIGDRAYKLKKPVKLGFLDFSTREKRLAACRREVELNRRLAPDAYLGVADVTDESGRLCDHLVVMRRMPTSRRLSTLVRDGCDVTDSIRALARLLAAFHERAATSPAISREATIAAVADKWAANFREIEEFVGEILDRGAVADLQSRVLRFLGGRGVLFEERIAAGLVRDCHGDLLADDIFCLPDGPRVLDCIEFDDRLRATDVAADVAFLMMDLERIGAEHVSKAFAGFYREFSRWALPGPLLDHYVAYRALIRCKVACIRAAMGDADATGEAHRLLGIAVDHARRADVRLVVVCGLPGTGKTTLAAAVAEAKEWVHLRSDVVRKQLAGLSPLDRAADRWRRGLYGAASTDRTYRHMLAQAEQCLVRGTSVVLDATFGDAAHRQAVEELAASTSSELRVLEARAPADVADARIRSRHADASDVTPEIAARMRSRWTPWREATGIDTTLPGDAAARAAITAVGVDAVPNSDEMSPYAFSAGDAEVQQG